MDRNITVSNAELEILEALWSADRPLNAGEIRNFLNENKKWERTTVLTLIKRLLEKGVISQEKKEVYYYMPCVKRNDYVNAEVKSFVDKFFGGSTRSLAAALVENQELSREDIEELREYFHKGMGEEE